MNNQSTNQDLLKSYSPRGSDVATIGKCVHNGQNLSKSSTEPARQFQSNLVQIILE
jgi:hypothetical protein